MRGRKIAYICVAIVIEPFSPFAVFIFSLRIMSAFNCAYKNIIIINIL